MGSNRQTNGDGAVFEGGASRSEFQPPYYLLEDCFLVATVDRMQKGALVHGRDNYKKGGPEFVLETFNHQVAHLMAIKSGDRTDDHIGAMCANALILTWHWHNKPENFRLLEGGDQPHPPDPVTVRSPKNLDRLPETIAKGKG